MLRNCVGERSILIGFSKLRSIFFVLAINAIAAITIGCGGSAPQAQSPRPTCPVPDAAQLEIEASDRVNLDETGRALPTRLWLYQLSDTSRISSASFEDMWSRPLQALAETRVAGEELTVYPGQVTVHRFKRDARADYLAVVANFREPDGEAWRTLQEWPARADACQGGGRVTVPERLRVRLFLEDGRIESVTNFETLPKQRCPPGSAACGAAAHELRRNRLLRTFEEDPREPEVLTK